MSKEGSISIKNSLNDGYDQILLVIGANAHQDSKEAIKFFYENQKNIETKVVSFDDEFKQEDFINNKPKDSFLFTDNLDVLREEIKTLGENSNGKKTLVVLWAHGGTRSNGDHFIRLKGEGTVNTKSIFNRLAESFKTDRVDVLTSACQADLYKEAQTLSKGSHLITFTDEQMDNVSIGSLSIGLKEMNEKAENFQLEKIGLSKVLKTMLKAGKTLTQSNLNIEISGFQNDLKIGDLVSSQAIKGLSRVDLSKVLTEFEEIVPNLDKILYISMLRDLASNVEKLTSLEIVKEQKTLQLMHEQHLKAIDLEVEINFSFQEPPPTMKNLSSIHHEVFESIPKNSEQRKIVETVISNIYNDYKKSGNSHLIENLYKEPEPNKISKDGESKKILSQDKIEEVYKAKSNDIADYYLKLDENIAALNKKKLPIASFADISKRYNAKLQQWIDDKNKAKQNAIDKTKELAAKFSESEKVFAKELESSLAQHLHLQNVKIMPDADNSPQNIPLEMRNTKFDIIKSANMLDFLAKNTKDPEIQKLNEEFKYLVPVIAEHANSDVNKSTLEQNKFIDSLYKVQGELKDLSNKANKIEDNLELRKDTHFISVIKSLIAKRKNASSKEAQLEEKWDGIYDQLQAITLAVNSDKKYYPNKADVSKNKNVKPDKPNSMVR